MLRLALQGSSLRGTTASCALARRGRVRRHAQRFPRRLLGVTFTAENTHALVPSACADAASRSLTDFVSPLGCLRWALRRARSRGHRRRLAAHRTRCGVFRQRCIVLSHAAWARVRAAPCTQQGKPGPSTDGVGASLPSSPRACADGHGAGDAAPRAPPAVVAGAARCRGVLVRRWQQRHDVCSAWRLVVLHGRAGVAEHNGLGCGGRWCVG